MADVIEDANDHLYVFTFVGVIVVLGRVLKCQPKYLQHQSDPIEEMKQVLKVLEKYNSNGQIIRMFNDFFHTSTYSGSFLFLGCCLFPSKL